MRNHVIFPALMTLLTFSILSSAFYKEDALNFDSAKLDSTLKEKIMGLPSKGASIPVIILLENESTIPREKLSKVKHRFNLINGFSAKLTKKDIILLAENKNVKKIYYDTPVHILPVKVEDTSIKLSTSTGAIGAPYVWNTLNYTGRNVTVAIVDTGIDYRHPDLGNCSNPGAGCRVRGCFHSLSEGLDRGENNCLDDHGHGTHVAGIVGAEGGVRGVAPNVSFLAVKVMDSQGSGAMSDVMAGIDWAVGHGARIISMSLGENSQPDDGLGPVNVIVDSAVKLGVFFAIAAGNEGPGTGTVASPGDSSLALTVGASDDHSTIGISDDTIAGFSNRGPAAYGRLKPEILAPGVGITSTQLGGGYTSMSGTSMATPHVAGAAALMLEYNPNLTPIEIKSRLMHSSANIPEHVFEKGCGIVNVTKAILYDTEAVVDDGRDYWRQDGALLGFNYTFRLEVRNFGKSAVNFTVSLEEPLTDLERDNTILAPQFVFPDYVFVQPNGSSGVAVQLSIPFNASPATYGSTIILNGNNSETLRIPVSVTVPLLEGGLIQGTVDDSQNGEQFTKWGDWIYYKIKSHNGSMLTATLNWSSSAYDLDLFLYTPNGVEANVSGMGNTNWEQLSADMFYDEYWLAVHAYTVSVDMPYNLTVAYESGVVVNPPRLQATLPRNIVSELKFNLTNNQVAKYNLSLDTVALEDNSSIFISGTVPANDYTWHVVWNAKNTTIPNINSTRYITALLVWNNSGVDLDMYLAYSNGSVWDSTRFGSLHYNRLLGRAFEKLEDVDVQYYLKKYSDFGIAVRNYNATPQNYNLTLNFTAYKSWDAVLTTPQNISTLAGNAVHEIAVNVNASRLNESKTYDAVLMVRDGADRWLAKVPIKISLNSTSPPLIYNPQPANDTVFPPYTTSLLLNITTDPVAICRYSNESGVSFENMTSDFNSTNSTLHSTLISNLTGNTTYFFYIRCNNSNGNYNTLDYVLKYRVSAPDIVLNEFMPSFNATDGWVELYNRGETLVDLGGWYLNSIGNATNDTYVIPNGTLILYGNFSVFYCNTTNLTLNPSMGEIRLYDRNLQLRDNLTYYDGLVLGNHAYNSSIAASIGRASDGETPWTLFNNPSPGTSNIQTLTQYFDFLVGWNMVSLPLQT